MISRDEVPYKSCYCEENIYKFLEILKNDNFYAVLISNDCQQIPLWRQKSDREFVIWDYHVIAVGDGNVFDLDTTLEFPQDFCTYFTQTLNLDIDLHDKYRRKFRVIPSAIYLDSFSSDRSHMQNIDGSWKMTPPDWPCINQEKSANLMDLIDMRKSINDTQVMDEQEFYDFFK